MPKGGNHLWGRGLRLLSAVGLMLLCAPASAQPSQAGEGWRGLLKEQAEVLWSATRRPGDVHAAHARAAASIEGLVASSGGLSAADALFADSLLMEVHAADGRIHDQEGHPAQAVVAYRDALDHAGDPSLVDRRVDLLCALSRAQSADGNVASALRTLKEGSAGFAAAKDTTHWRRLLLERSYLCRDRRQFTEGIEANTDLLAIENARRDDRGRLGAELALSRCYEGLGSGEAFLHANTAYQIAETTGNDQGLLDATDRLIATYNETQQLDKCRELLERALAKAETRNIAVDIAKFQNAYGRFHMRLGEYEEAVKRHEAGLGVLSGAGGSMNALTAKHLGLLHQDLGRCYLAMEDQDRALRHLLSADSLAPLAGPGALAPWAELGEIYLDEGEVSQAADYGMRALRQGRADGDTRMLQRASKVLYEVYKRKGDAANALEMHELFKASSDSLRNESYALDLMRTQLGVQHAAELLTDSLKAEVEKEQLRADRETTRQRTRVLIIGGIVLFLAAGLVAVVDRKRRLARFDKDAAQLETQALRSQMNPHFIFNALNSINSFVQRNDPDRASSYLSKFARLMRLVLENSRQAEVPLKDDLEALDVYLQLERTRSGERFDYTIKVDLSINPEDVMVPPLVAQPFVENAIWHGMAGRTDKGRITLSVSRKKDDLIFAIEDDGVGRHAPKAEAEEPADAAMVGKKTSLGTAITKARLDLVSQQKGRPAGFKYIDLPQGTRVELTLPISSAA